MSPRRARGAWNATSGAGLVLLFCLYGFCALRVLCVLLRVESAAAGRDA